MAVCGREVVEESFESGLDGGPSCDVHLLLARGRGYLYELFWADYGQSFGQLVS